MAQLDVSARSGGTMGGGHGMKGVRRSPKLVALVVIAAAVAVLAGVTAALFFASASLDVQSRTRDQAFAEMDFVRGRFADATPCLDRAPGRGVEAAPRPATVHMLAWEREDDRLVRVAMPYWALRAGSWKLNAVRLVAPPLEHVRLADLERCRRGLVLDRHTAGGGRVLIWLE